MLPWGRVVDALDDAMLSAFAAGQFVDRSSVPCRGGELLIMPAAGETLSGVKLVGVGRDNPEAGLPRISAVFVAFDSATLIPRAVLDGTSLTAVRTAGQSAAVVRRLAPSDAGNVVVFGAGIQARAHVLAVASVRPVRSVRVVARRPGPVAALCAALAAELPGVDVAPGTAVDVRSADLVLCTTTSSEPVFDGRDLTPGTLVVAVGSHTPDARELDEVVFGRASTVVVEQRATAMREAGDVIQAVAAGTVRESDLLDFADLGAGRVAAVGTEGILVYKSVGMGYQDLALVASALEAGQLLTAGAPVPS